MTHSLAALAIAAGFTDAAHIPAHIKYRASSTAHGPSDRRVMDGVRNPEERLIGNQLIPVRLGSPVRISQKGAAC